MNKKITTSLMLLVVCVFSASNIVHANNKEDLKQTVALILNLNGHLCAKVIDISPLKIKNQYEVICVANRGGSATKNYILNAADGTAFEQ